VVKCAFTHHEERVGGGPTDNGSRPIMTVITTPSAIPCASTVSRQPEPPFGAFFVERSCYSALEPTAGLRLEGACEISLPHLL
jgi:hypothetical protein